MTTLDALAAVFKVVEGVGGVEGGGCCQGVGPCMSTRRSGWVCLSSGDETGVTGEAGGFGVHCGAVLSLGEGTTGSLS